jgi:4-hydroxy-4-methyl-2-oxoglutarate aldolase
MDQAEKGDILVIDNDGRMDEGCIGDLTVLEAQLAGIGGIIINGCHRDTAELVKIGFPVFSYGSFPAGPLRPGRRHPGSQRLTKYAKFVQYRQDYVFADDDGVIFIPESRSHQIIETANQIYEKERDQAEKIKSGISLREQLKFKEYLQERDKNYEYTFRKHLRKLGGAIEE